MKKTKSKIDFEKMKIKLASQSRTKKLKPEIDLILKELGHPEALVTDESRLSDFGDVNKKAAKMSKKFNIKIEAGNYLVDIAEKITNNKF